MKLHESESSEGAAMAHTNDISMISVKVKVKFDESESESSKGATMAQCQHLFCESESATVKLHESESE